ncbi:uncharacterized protein PHALS_06486 [Plasmopara halstedii]|uniref:Uncharacterized protein n=1 Tax=Plasmopara halstedii TaxID=4781 RepID=A0A0N7L823_PLAHL|nr:uncharacterized protein PHALS_06486 [Plasmopara halstedii]CEG48675.1 hypothetical protein PHALS_06486 [Plasmopara halstedii]|eukprot:XP_024585044.1 hypothetical protein PHALS_06486 [Plasmopara halstedii]
MTKPWDDDVDGAWAPGKAPVNVLTTFLKCVHERDSVGAEQAALEILKTEPNNLLVRDLLNVIKQQDVMDAEETQSINSEFNENLESEDDGSDEVDFDDLGEDEHKGDIKVHSCRKSSFANGMSDKGQSSLESETLLLSTLEVRVNRASETNVIRCTVTDQVHRLHLTKALPCGENEVQKGAATAANGEYRVDTRSLQSFENHPAAEVDDNADTSI